jgi:thiamine biosynthesis protein ThiS
MLKQRNTTFFQLNGKQYKIISFSKITLFHIVKFFNFKLNLIVIEYDGKIIPMNKYKYIFIKNNINIEIVTVVGGG